MISARASTGILHRSLRASSRRPTIQTPLIITQSRRGIWLEAATSSAQIFQHAHHSLGLEWYLAIPAVAALFNFTIRFPLSIYTAMQATKRRKLEPLVKIWRNVHMFDANEAALREMRESSIPPNPAEFRQKVETKARNMVTKEIHRMNKTWGLQSWKSVVAALTSIPPYMAFVGALSSLSGLDRGWVRMVLPAQDWFEPSLTTGGMLWFQNLAEVDPLGLLPVITMGLFWVRSFITVGKEATVAALGNGAKTAMTPTSVTLIRLQYLYPVVFAMMGQWIPASGMLFIISSTLISMVNRPLANRLLQSRIRRLHTIKGTETKTSKQS